MSAPAAGAVWSGSWVSGRLGVGLRTTAAPVGVPLESLVGLALRRNPRRAHLLVSTVLGKHVPTDPRLVLGAARLLGLLVARALRDDDGGRADDDALRGAGRALADALAGTPGAAAALLAATTPAATAPAAARTAGCAVLGYAETATALSHAVADVLGAPHLHSTRRSVPGAAALGGFEEEHSHATGHLLLPDDPALLARGGVLVLVDDELSTGRTVLNTVAALKASAPSASAPLRRCVVAALVDLRSPRDRAATEAAARELGTRIDVVALVSGEVDLPPDVLERGARLVAQHQATQHGATQRGAAQQVLRAAPPPPASPPAPVVDLGAAGWPSGVREGARHGATPQDAAALDAAVAAVAARLAAHLTGSGTASSTTSSRPEPRRVLVLGHEELMHAPQRLAAALADALEPSGAVVRSSATTRSPVLAVDDEGYAVRTALVFRAADGEDAGTGERFAYNVAPTGLLGEAPQERYDDVVVVVDDAVDPAALAAPDGLLPAVAGACRRVTLVTLPAHPPQPGERTDGSAA